jgi:hypothetical protein
MSEKNVTEQSYIDALSRLALNPDNSEEGYRFVAGLSDQERMELLSLADSNHVILRALKPVHERATRDKNLQLAAWAENSIADERKRIANMLEHMERVCNGLEAAGCPTTVMKTLDHWPDIGNDIDLYSTAQDARIAEVMQREFNAEIEPRSWGDRLAHKWNFAIPGLKEPVEIHVRRLGQTGEHTDLAKRFVSRRQEKVVDGKKFWVPAPEERIVVATLQRMYRHFYFRVCDIANTAALVESGTLNYGELKRVSEFAGIWPGVATYLLIVSGYIARYRGEGLDLPKLVTDGARFGAEKVRVRGKFIRVPIMPQGAALYTEQVTRTALRGDVPATFRLQLLPPLAVAAAVAFKLTGSDKGVW